MLSALDYHDLARHHVACLTDSFVTELGEGYARHFYRYIEHSPKDHVFVARDADGRIVAATVGTMEPHTLSRRLLLGTPLLWHALLRVHRILPTLVRSLRRPAEAREPVKELDMPEWILLFTAESERGRKLGSRLREETEAEFRRQGVKVYQVRTAADPANKALEFHLKHGSIPSHRSYDRGRWNQVFTMRLDE